MNTLTEKQLLETYGKYRLVAFMVDETDYFNDALKQYANGKIFNCYITTLGELFRWHNPACMSAGYCMTQPYDYDDEEDEDEEGSYRWMEDQLRDVWVDVDCNEIRDVYPKNNFFILDDYWQLDLNTAREVYAELQRSHTYVGYMKPSRDGNWYDRFDKEDRKQQFMYQLFSMLTTYGDFTSNGTIPDNFVYDEELGWRSVYREAKEFVKVPGNYFTNDLWTEVGD